MRARAVQLAAVLCATLGAALVASCTSGARRANAESGAPADSTAAATTGSAVATGSAAAPAGAAAVPATDTTHNVRSATEPPTLTRLAPDTIRLGRGEAPTLTLTGSGFVPGHTGGSGGFAVGGNAIHVGRATFDMIPADTAGRTIRFAMPLTYTDTAARGRPSSFAPGTFSVSVTTPSGTSNALTLVMIP
ncbi:MAG: hypothetical protein IT359_09095 [Gemmatimonadaceae bacterium]|nr:hypothetical protein [Gemmatimonadaceae bacterium]